MVGRPEQTQLMASKLTPSPKSSLRARSRETILEKGRDGSRVGDEDLFLLLFLFKQREAGEGLVEFNLQVRHHLELRLAFQREVQRLAIWL